MPMPRRCSAPPSTAPTSPPRALPTSPRRGLGRPPSCTGTTTNTVTAASATSPRRSAMPARTDPSWPSATPLAVRHALYQQAREANPRRWSGPTRNWTPIGAVTLNPERDSVVAAALQPMLSGSTDGPALSSRPGDPAAAARSGGDGRRAATRSHAQQGEHGEAGEHRTFAAASTVAASSAVGRHRPPPPG